MRHLVLMGLPQLGVVTAFGEFQHAVLTTLAEASGSMQLDLLADTMLVVVLGALTLAANGVIAVYLLKRAATIDARCSPRKRAGGRRFGPGRRPARGAPVSPTPGSAGPSRRENRPLAVRHAGSRSRELRP